MAALAAAPRAHAQPGTTLTAEPDTRSTTEAVLLSVGGTAVSVGLVAGGASTSSAWMIGGGLLTSLFTPALGHWYAGDMFTPGLGMRLGGAVIAVVGLPSAAEASSGEGGHGTVAIFVGGIALYVTGVIYDVATAHQAARRWNARHVQIAPSVISSGAHATLGVGLGGSF